MRYILSISLLQLYELSNAIRLSFSPYRALRTVPFNRLYVPEAGHLTRAACNWNNFWEKYHRRLFTSYTMVFLGFRSGTAIKME
jgi:hypothetical protein